MEASGTGKLITAANEIYGRFGEEAVQLIQRLAKMRAQKVPRLVRKAAQTVCALRWSALLGCALQQACADAILFKGGYDIATSTQTALHFADE